ncbi:MAG: helix-hairpin-helix domain-containing protein [Sulfurimonas sp.]
MKIMLRYFYLLIFSITQLFAIVDINNASSSELLELNGVGKAKSVKILNYREQNGCFKSIDELARVEGISKSIVSSNRNILRVGICAKSATKDDFTPASYIDILLDPINLVFIVVIFILAAIDLIKHKDLKAQIVSIGVLGTFVGIFIGLQSFNPQDIMNSVNDILVGLKTAFFTSIVGMSVSTALSVFQTLKASSETK